MRLLIISGSSYVNGDVIRTAYQTAILTRNCGYNNKSIFEENESLIALRRHSDLEVENRK